MISRFKGVQKFSHSFLSPSSERFWESQKKKLIISDGAYKYYYQFKKHSPKINHISYEKHKTNQKTLCISKSSLINLENSKLIQPFKVEKFSQFCNHKKNASMNSQQDQQNRIQQVANIKKLQENINEIKEKYRNYKTKYKNLSSGSIAEQLRQNYLKGIREQFKNSERAYSASTESLLKEKSSYLEQKNKNVSLQAKYSRLVNQMCMTRELQSVKRKHCEKENSKKEKQRDKQYDKLLKQNEKLSKLFNEQKNLISYLKQQSKSFQFLPGQNAKYQQKYHKTRNYSQINNFNDISINVLYNPANNNKLITPLRFNQKQYVFNQINQNQQNSPIYCFNPLKL